jgi:hypothetical protein
MFVLEDAQDCHLIPLQAVAPGFILTSLISVDEETKRTFAERAGYAPYGLMAESV